MSDFLQSRDKTAVLRGGKINFSLPAGNEVVTAAESSVGVGRILYYHWRRSGRKGNPD